MANDIDMMKDVFELKEKEETRQQGDDLYYLYFYKFTQPDPDKLTKLKERYVKKYEFLDNYV